jgi:threo-3-hydroxy-L-aspartate ammonia-lyase
MIQAAMPWNLKLSKISHNYLPNNMKFLSIDDVIAAQKRIANYVIKTPVVTADFLNEKLNNQIFFKLESHQKTGSFKARGALNHLLYLKEINQLPKKVVAVSSGNHAQAVAYTCKMLKIPAIIYTSKIASKIKIQATRLYGAEVVITEKRTEANDLALEKIKEGYHFIHPSDDDLIIAGQGTSCLEALEEIGKVDTIFSPCGGGGLVSGCYLAAENSDVFAVEPQNANDAALSLKNGKIFHFQDSPETICDGARTLAVSERTLQYLQKMKGILLASEEEIIYWTQWLNYLLKTTIEPTSALAMAGCFNYIKENNISGKKMLVILSGGNIDADSNRKIWEKDYLTTVINLI